MAGKGHWIGIALAAVVAVAPGAAIAQGQVPAREGNIWGGVNHEPNPAQVGPQERAAGLDAPGSAQEQNDDVDRLYRSLMRAEGESGGEP